jgi:hypothetical protein
VSEFDGLRVLDKQHYEATVEQRKHLETHGCGGQCDLAIDHAKQVEASLEAVKAWWRNKEGR